MTEPPDSVPRSLHDIWYGGYEAAKRDSDTLQWTLDNIYTIARRELRHGDPRERWGHVIRLCEKAGCQSRGVLRDNGGSVG